MEEIIKKYIEKNKKITEMSYTYSIFNRMDLSDNELLIYNIKESNILEDRKPNVEYIFGNPLIRKTINHTDLLYIDTIHNSARLRLELNSFSKFVSNNIIITGTRKFGNSDELGNGKGLLVSIEEFIENNPEWVVLESIVDGDGLVILGKKEIKVEEPNIEDEAVEKVVKKVRKKTTKKDNGTS